jgi:hypothetical protein
LTAIPEKDLFDATRVAAAALERTDWKGMRPVAVAYLVLQAAGSYLMAAVQANKEDEEASREQRARDALAARTRERYPWIHGGD